MPLSREEFKKMGKKNVKQRILDFLIFNKELSWTYKELAEELKLPIGSITPNLSQLLNEKKVEHKGKYWIYNINYEEDDENVNTDTEVFPFIHDNAINSNTNWANSQGVVRWKKSQERSFRKLFDQDYQGIMLNGKYIGKPKPDFSSNRRIPIRGLRGNTHELEIERDNKGCVIIKILNKK